MARIQERRVHDGPRLAALSVHPHGSYSRRGSAGLRPGHIDQRAGPRHAEICGSHETRMSHSRKHCNRRPRYLQTVRIEGHRHERCPTHEAYMARRHVLRIAAALEKCLQLASLEIENGDCFSLLLQSEDVEQHGFARRQQKRRRVKDTSLWFVHRSCESLKRSTTTSRCPEE